MDGQWHPGELRSWDRAEDETWSGMMTWSAGPAEQRLDRFPAEVIRPVSEDA